MLVYDGQSETVQAATLKMFASVAQTISFNLTAPAAAGVLVRDLAALEAVQPDDNTGYATALSNLLTDYVSAILSDPALDPDPTLLAGYEDSSRLPPMPTDPTQGLYTLATAVFTPSNATGVIATNGAALDQIVNGLATSALVMLYAQMSFASSQDADTAREQIFGLIVAQIEAAQGDDVTVQDWRALETTAVTDLTTRAKQLPLLATLETSSPMPAIYLAQLLYQDGSQADVLVQRNAAPHKLFLPLEVEYLQAA